MATKLDRSRPFGEIIGGNTGARYEQDGNQFDAAESLIQKEDKTEKPAKKKEKTETN